MKNINFLNVGTLMIIVFMITFNSAFELYEEDKRYKELPRLVLKYDQNYIRANYKTNTQVSYPIMFIGSAVEEIKIDNTRSSFWNNNWNSYREANHSLFEILIDTTQLLPKLNSSKYDYIGL